MFIKVDKWTEAVLSDSAEYIGKPNYLTIKEEKYIDVEELVGTIEELNSELERQVDKVKHIDNQIQNFYVQRKNINPYE